MAEKQYSSTRKPHVAQHLKLFASNRGQILILISVLVSATILFLLSLFHVVVYCPSLFVLKYYFSPLHKARTKTAKTIECFCCWRGFMVNLFIWSPRRKLSYILCPCQQAFVASVTNRCTFQPPGGSSAFTVSCLFLLRFFKNCEENQTALFHHFCSKVLLAFKQIQTVLSRVNTVVKHGPWQKGSEPEKHASQTKHFKML